MAAAPLQQQQQPAAFSGRRSNSAKSRAFLASIGAIPNDGQQQQQQQHQHGGPTAGADAQTSHEWQPVAIAASALANMDRVRLDASAHQQQLQRDSDAAPPPQPQHSSSGLHHQPASLESRTLEQVDRLVARHSFGDAPARRQQGGGQSAHAKVMMWDMSAPEPDGAPLPPPISGRGTPTSQPVTPIAEPLLPAPALQAAKNEAALTALSAGAGVKLSDFRRHTRLSADAINALEPRKERRMNAEERTLRWLDQLEVPAMLEAELRRPGGSSSVRSHAGAGAKSVRHPAMPPATANAGARRDRPAPVPQPQEQQYVQEELQPQPQQQVQQQAATKPQSQGLFSCFSCTTAVD